MKKHALLASAGIFSALFATAAHAEAPAVAPQAAPQAEISDGFGDAIIVTARRRAEDVSKVPVAITAFSGDQLVAKGITSTLDLSKVAPGLTISGGGTLTNPFVVIRAQSKAVTGNSSPGVITYLNDVPLPSNGSPIQTYDMQNVQVLKGPQGTLFGRNSIGGALLTVTKAPSHEFGGYVTGTMQQYDYYQVEGAVNVPIIKDKVALRLAAQVGHDGGDIKTYLYSPYSIAPVLSGGNVVGFTATPGELLAGNRNYDEYATESYRASLLIEPTDWIKNVTIGDYTKVRGTVNSTYSPGAAPGLYALDPSIINAVIGQGAPVTDPQGFFASVYSGVIIPSLAQCAANTINCNFSAFSAAAANSIGDRVSYASEDPWIARTIIKGLTNTTTIRLGDNHQLKNIFAIRTTDVFTNTSLTGTPLAIVDTASATKLKQTTEEIQLSGSFLDNDLKYTVGGFFYNEKPNGTAGFSALEINAFFGLSHSLTTTYLHNSSKAVYGQIDYSLDKLIPGLSLTAGLRQTWDTQSACTVSQAISPFAPTPMLIVTPEDVDTYVPSEDACTSATGLAGAAIGASAQTFPDAKFKKLTYTLGANYQVTPDALVYLAHRRGYRAGGYNTPLLDPYLSAEQTFQPETLTDWELGLKARAQLGSVRATLDLAVYSGKDTANQLPLNTSNLTAGVCIVDALGTPGHPTSDCAVGGTPGSLVYVIGATNIVNGATLTIRGVEASGTLSPFRGLTFTGALSYNDITVDSIQVGDRFQNFLNAAGLPAVFSIQGQPKWTSNAGVLVDVPGEILGGKLSASFDYHYTGALTSVALTVPSFHQMDLRFNLNDIGGTGVSAAAWVKNLTNETIYAGTSSSSPTAGAYSFIIGAPRTVGMSLSYKFGAR